MCSQRGSLVRRCKMAIKQESVGISAKYRDRDAVYWRSYDKHFSRQCELKCRNGLYKLFPFKPETLAAWLLYFLHTRQQPAQMNRVPTHQLIHFQIPAFPVAERSKARVCGRWLAGFESRPGKCRVVREKSLRRTDPSSTGVLQSVMTARNHSDKTHHIKSYVHDLEAFSAFPAKQNAHTKWNQPCSDEPHGSMSWLEGVRILLR